MEALFFLLRVPVFLIGLLLCSIVLPLDYALMAAALIYSHISIAVIRLFGAPFVIAYSAWLDRSAWPEYLKRWQKAHDSVNPDWERPFKRFSELSTWLTEGPGGGSSGGSSGS